MRKTNYLVHLSYDDIDFGYFFSFNFFPLGFVVIQEFSHIHKKEEVEETEQIQFTLGFLLKLV